MFDSPPLRLTVSNTSLSRRLCSRCRNPADLDGRILNYRNPSFANRLSTRQLYLEAKFLFELNKINGVSVFKYSENRLLKEQKRVPPVSVVEAVFYFSRCFSKNVSELKELSLFPHFIGLLFSVVKKNRVFRLTNNRVKNIISYILVVTLLSRTVTFIQFCSWFQYSIFLKSGDSTFCCSKLLPKA